MQVQCVKNYPKIMLENNTNKKSHNMNKNFIPDQFPSVIHLNFLIL